MPTLALLGSGEFTPWARDADGWSVENSTVGGDRVLVVPTASAPEGPDVFARWAAMGLEHYRAMGLSPEVVELRTRDDAKDPAAARSVEGARYIFFSGGNPGYLCEVLADTPFWDAVVAAVGEGTALGGCSAGAVAMGVLAPYVSGDQIDRFVDGLKLLPRAAVYPHFDALDTYMEGLREMLLSTTPDGAIAVWIDEGTALCGDGERWRVTGSGAAWVADRPGPGAAIAPVRDREETVVRLIG
jgi:cyanophycinase-like exopeptidase